MRCGAYVCYLIRKGELYTIENETITYGAEHKVRYSHSVKPSKYQNSPTPKAARNLTNTSRGSSFVKMSASICCIVQYLRSILELAICLRMKWWRMLMCLAQEWATGLRDKAMQPWLSAWMMEAFTCGYPRSSRRVRSQMASRVACDAAMYSASIVECATVGCFLDDHEMCLPAISKVNPLTERRVSRSWAQSESVHSTRSVVPSVPWLLPSRSLKCAVPLRFKMRFSGVRAKLRKNSNGILNVRTSLGDV